MKKQLFSMILCGIGAAALLTSCDSISEDDRFIPTEINPQRAVLLEEFTGQECTNCPDGHAKVQEITAALGDSVVAVGIHASELADMRPVIGLGNSTGEAYYKAAGATFLPSATIDMQTAPLKLAEWGAAIDRLIMVPTPFTVVAHADLSADQSTYDITVDFSSGEDYEGNLMVWICENNIVRRQLDHGTYKNEYVHQHVFRTAVTSDIWGDPVSMKAHTPQKKEYSYTINPADYWNLSEIYVVAFLYNNSGGVAQVTSTLRH